MEKEKVTQAGTWNPGDSRYVFSPGSPSRAEAYLQKL